MRGATSSPTPQLRAARKGEPFKGHRTLIAERPSTADAESPSHILTYFRGAGLSADVPGSYTARPPLHIHTRNSAPLSKMLNPRAFYLNNLGRLPGGGVTKNASTSDNAALSDVDRNPRSTRRLIIGRYRFATHVGPFLAPPPPGLVIFSLEEKALHATGQAHTPSWPVHGPPLPLPPTPPSMAGNPNHPTNSTFFHCGHFSHSRHISPISQCLIILIIFRPSHPPYIYVTLSRPPSP
jgi:hypothetical protein